MDHQLRYLVMSGVTTTEDTRLRMFPAVLVLLRQEGRMIASRCWWGNLLLHAVLCFAVVLSTTSPQDWFREWVGRAVFLLVYFILTALLIPAIYTYAGKVKFRYVLNSAELALQLVAGRYLDRSSDQDERRSAIAFLRRLVSDPDVYLAGGKVTRLNLCLGWGRSVAVVLASGGSVVVVVFCMFNGSVPRIAWLVGTGIALCVALMEFGYSRGVRLETLAKFLVHELAKLTEGRNVKTVLESQRNVSLALAVNCCQEGISKQNRRNYFESVRDLSIPYFPALIILGHFLAPAFRRVVAQSPDWSWLLKHFPALFIYALVAVTYLVATTSHELIVGIHNRYAASTRQRLDASDLGTQLAMGIIDADKLQAAVPWIFGWMLNWPRMPRNLVNPLDRDIWLVAYNLDWFLGPPRRLVRLHWIGMAVQWLATPAILILTLAFAYGKPSATVGYLSACIVLLITSVITCVYRHRRGIWSGELIKYLRKQLLGDQEQPG